MSEWLCPDCDLTTTSICRACNSCCLCDCWEGLDDAAEEAEDDEALAVPGFLEGCPCGEDH